MAQYLAARSRTRSAIESAFWDLYLEKNFRRVTVREITETAGIHRSTFYQYFDSVGDIFDAIKEQQITLLREVCRITETEPSSHEAHLNLLKALQKLFNENRRFLKPLLVDYHSSSFSLEYRQILKETLKKDIGFHRYPEDSDAWFMIDNLTAGLIEMLFQSLSLDRYDIEKEYYLTFSMVEAAREVLRREFHIT